MSAPPSAPAAKAPANPPSAQAPAPAPASKSPLAPPKSGDLEIDRADVNMGGGKFSVPRQRLSDLLLKREEQEAIYESLGKFDGIIKGLDSDPDKGITTASLEARRQQYGKNEIPGDEPITFWMLVKEAFSDHTIQLLCVAAVIAIIIGMTTKDPDTNEYKREKNWIEGFAIVVSVIIVVLVTTINDYNKEKKFQQLTEAGAKVDIVVRRDGRDTTIDISEIVVGDIVMINSGLVLPCDGLYVRGQSVVVDESSATGENDPKKKSAAHPFFMGYTSVNTAESAWMLAIAVGEYSFGGSLLMAARGEGGRRQTPLQEKLDDMAENIGKIGLTIALILFGALCIIEIVQFATDDPDAKGVDFLNYFIISVSVIVVAVPEGLPLSVTIALAYSQSKMMEDNNQVRRLAACETMGNATQICSDKTGTLTQNLMSVKQGYLCSKHFALNDAGAVLVEAKLPDYPPNILRLFCEGISYNSSSEKQYTTTDGKASWQWRKDMGNKTENGMLDFVDRVMLKESPDLKKKLPHQILRAQAGPNGMYLFPFTSDRKRMSTFIRDPTTKNWNTLHVKGASEKILELCDSYHDGEGKVVPMSEEIRKDIADRITSFAREANRTIGVAYRSGLNVDGSADPEEPEVPLIWLGVVGIQDPLRPEVKDAVERCQHAGVVVRMCTGDNIDTAVAIAIECGIYKKGVDLALTGAQFREIVFRKDTPEAKAKNELSETLKKMTVMARCQPLDKQLLVLMLMMQGEVVAVTGDGTNDAPALKLANVGFVMKSGTDIAVKSSDIVLLDDNFRSVQRAVVWGRTVNDNIRKFLQFQLTVNVVCVGLTFVGSLSAEGTFPLKAVQLLWINLMMDSLAALSLSTELPNEECLNRGPIMKKAPVITRKMWRFILFQAMYQLTCTVMLLHKAHDWFWVSEKKFMRSGKEVTKLKFNTEHTTIVFNVFVFCVIFNEFNARKLYDEVNIFAGYSRSKFFVVIVFIMAGFQIFAVEVTRDFMSTTPLSWKQWLVCVAFGLGSWPWGFIMRFIPVHERVYDKEFDVDDLDKEARKFYDQLQLQIEEAQKEAAAQKGAVVAAKTAELSTEEKNAIKEKEQAARREQARANWKKADSVRQHVSVVHAIRRARDTQSLRSRSARELFDQYTQKHPSAY